MLLMCFFCKEREFEVTRDDSRISVQQLLQLTELSRGAGLLLMRFQSRSLQLDGLQTYTQFGCWGSDCDSQDAPAAARALAQQEARSR